MIFSSNYARDHSLYMLVSATVLGRSTNGGQSWVSTSRPQVDISVPSLAVADASTLFLGLGGGPPYLYPQQGLFYSEDAGGTWARLYAGGVTDVAVSPNYSQDHTVLIGIGGYHWDGGLLRSTDSGHTWQESNQGIELGAEKTTQITFSPGYATDQTIFCLGGIYYAPYKSTDGGVIWGWPTGTERPPYLGVDKLIVSPRYPQDQTIWLAGVNEGHVMSTDGGGTWQTLPYAVSPLAAGEYCLVEGSCGVLLFGRFWDGQDDYVYKSFDGGQTWHCLKEDMTPVTPTPEPPPAPEIPEAATGLLLASGLAGLGGYLWWKRR